MRAMNHKTIEQTVGNTPLVRLQRMPGDTTNTILVKLEGNNPAGSVKDRPALNMIMKAEARGEGRVLDQFANPDNPMAHYESTGPEIWRDTEGGVTHFVSSMGTTGTIMGCSMYLKEQNPAIQIIGLQPTEGSSIPGIRRWPKEYLPSIYDDSRVDRVIDMDQALAEHTMRRLAREEGISCGVSSGGAVAGALRLSEELENAVIVAIICDRGDRYLSTGVFQGA
jgi:cysteine synthase B